LALYRHFATQAELDAEYDVGRSVPDFKAIAAFYDDTSSRARREMRCQLDLPYGPTRAEHLGIFPAERPMHPF
jgi:arylformamidase